MIDYKTKDTHLHQKKQKCEKKFQNFFIFPVTFLELCCLLGKRTQKQLQKTITKK